MRPDSGVSLVEILIVLAIIAVLASMAVIGTGGADRSGRADTEARQFAARLSLAADQALTSDRTLRLVWDATAYRFHGPDGDGGPARDLPRPLRLSGDAPRELAISPDLAAAARWTITGGGRAAAVEFDGLTARVLADGG
jgi:general secretion pathway protein H